VGQTWRKHGPEGWIRIVGIMMDGFPGYDGVLPGVSVQFRSWKGKWLADRWFFPCKTPKEFIERQREYCRYLQK